MLECAPLSQESKQFGAIAQLGERNTGSVEVSGSIPLSSTKYKKGRIREDTAFFVFGCRCGIEFKLPVHKEPLAATQSARMGDPAGVSGQSPRIIPRARLKISSRSAVRSSLKAV